MPTRRLNEQVKRNNNRFPDDFMFQLTCVEKQEVVTPCEHFPDRIKRRLKFSRTLPCAFTEHDAIQAANVLNTSQAIAPGTAPAFTHFHHPWRSNGCLCCVCFRTPADTGGVQKQLTQRLDELEQRIEHKMATHDEAITE